MTPPSKRRRRRRRRFASQTFFVLTQKFATQIPPPPALLLIKAHTHTVFFSFFCATTTNDYDARHQSWARSVRGVSFLRRVHRAVQEEGQATVDDVPTRVCFAARCFPAKCGRTGIVSDWHDDDDFRLGRTADGFRWQRSRGPGDAVPILLRDGRERYDQPVRLHRKLEIRAREMFASLAKRESAKHGESRNEVSSVPSDV